jgi:hypothetical protein
VTVKATLTTNDSVNDITRLNDLDIKFIVNSDIPADNSADTAKMLTAWRTGASNVLLFDHSTFDGLIYNGDGGFYLTSEQNASIDLFGINTTAVPRNFKTIEMLIRRQPGHVSSSTYYYFSYYDGSTEYSLYHDGAANNDKFAGFDTCYVNGQVFTSGSTLPFGTGWAHVILTKAGWAGGAPGLSDPGRFNFNMRYGSGTKYYGHASYRSVAIYPTIFSSQTAAQHYNRYIGIDLLQAIDTSTRTVTDNVVYASTQYPQVISTGWQIVSSI